MISKETFESRIRSACEEAKWTEFKEGSYTCKEFAAQVYVSAGYNTSALESAPPHSLDYGRFHSDSPLIEFIMENPGCRSMLKPVDIEDGSQCGDLLVLREGKARHHVAIAYSSQLIFHLPRYGRVSSLSIRMLQGAKAIAAVFRPKQLPEK